MTEKRYTIKPQDDLFGVVDNYSADKVCIVNGIRTEIETKWLCDVMNDLNDENEQLKEALIELRQIGDYQYARIKELSDENEQLNQYVLYLKSVLEDNEIWYNDGDGE